jgi:molybdopterin/thiamine biosynthesis adenylyltransferase
VVLSADELERYDRQMLINGWGTQGQERLKDSNVVVVGVGGLGCPVSLYLVAAGVGTLVLIDEGRFELSNLNRQILGWTKDVGRLKVESVTEKLLALNPNVKAKAASVRIDEGSVSEVISESDAVVDCLDNWETRFILNRACVEQRKPLIHAGIRGLYGQAMTILPGKGPCLRCLLPETPPDIPRFPVLGATPGLFAMIQVMETLKVLLGIGDPLVNRMLVFDGVDTSFTTIDVKRSMTCPVCGHL